jgi:type I restriction enzyme, R subunit
MNLDNFIVRPQRQLVETFAQPENWKTLQPEQLDNLALRVAGLPTELPAEDEEAKRFDLLMLRLQLARLNADPSLTRLCQQVKAIATALEGQDSIPIICEQMPLIQDLQSDIWWEDVTIPMLESARKRLRSPIGLIEKTQRKPIYTDFVDELGLETNVDLPELGNSTEFDRFRAKARQFLRAHEDRMTLYKLKFNQPLTAVDLSELERILQESGIGTPEHLEFAKRMGLGVFIRSLIGLDREAAKQAFGAFLSGSTASANQIEFINLIIDYLTHHGIMEPSLLYESPFTDISHQGPEGIFSPEQVNALVAVLNDIRTAAA